MDDQQSCGWRAALMHFLFFLFFFLFYSSPSCVRARSLCFCNLQGLTDCPSHQLGSCCNLQSLSTVRPHVKMKVVRAITSYSMTSRQCHKYHSFFFFLFFFIFICVFIFHFQSVKARNRGGGVYHVPHCKDSGASALALLSQSSILLKRHPPTMVHGVKKRQKRRRRRKWETPKNRSQREQKIHQQVREIHCPLTGQAGTKIPKIPNAICVCSVIWTFLVCWELCGLNWTVLALSELTTVQH